MAGMENGGTAGQSFFRSQRASGNFGTGTFGGHLWNAVEWVGAKSQPTIPLKCLSTCPCGAAYTFSAAETLREDDAVRLALTERGHLVSMGVSVRNLTPAVSLSRLRSRRRTRNVA